MREWGDACLRVAPCLPPSSGAGYARCFLSEDVFARSRMVAPGTWCDILARRRPMLHHGMIAGGCGQCEVSIVAGMHARWRHPRHGWCKHRRRTHIVVVCASAGPCCSTPGQELCDIHHGVYDFGAPGHRSRAKIDRFRACAAKLAISPAKVIPNLVAGQGFAGIPTTWPTFQKT